MFACSLPEYVVSLVLPVVFIAILNPISWTPLWGSAALKMILQYRKNPKISDTRKFAVITLKVEQDGFTEG